MYCPPLETNSDFFFFFFFFPLPVTYYLFIYRIFKLETRAVCRSTAVPMCGKQESLIFPRDVFAFFGNVIGRRSLNLGKE